MNSRGFTLIELLAVLLIGGLIAGVATWHAGALLQATEAKDAIEELKQCDRLARQMSQSRRDPMVVEIATGFIRVASTSNDQVIARRPIRHWTLRSVKQFQADKVEENTSVRFDAGGRSPTYLVELERAEQRRWVLFPGGGGAAVEFANPNDATQAIQSLQRLLAH